MTGATPTDDARDPGPAFPFDATGLARDSLVVVKVGGGASLDFDGLYDDLARLTRAGVRWVLVHGGNAELTALQERIGSPARFVEDGKGRVSRYTDAEAIDLFAMAYAGKLNVRHVCALRARGVDALGLTGVDGGLLTARRRARLRCVEDGRKKVLRDDHTGTLTGVNGDLLRLLLDQGHAPVVTVPAYADGPEGEHGVPINIDGDTAAARIAEVLGADALVFLSDVPGLLADVDDPGSRIARVEGAEGWAAAFDAVRGRMHRKVEGARDAVAAGVGRVVFAAANADRPLVGALTGTGTVFTGPVPAPAPSAAPPA